MRFNQSLVVQRDRQHRNGFRRGTGEIIKHPALAFLLAPLRQPFAIVWILIFAERMKLFARDVSSSIPTVPRPRRSTGRGGFHRRRSNHSAPDARRNTFGIRQIFMGNRSKHGTRFYRFFKKLYASLAQSLIFFPAFIFRIGAIVPEPHLRRRACLAHERGSKLNPDVRFSCLSVCLNFLPVEVYVIHQMHLADGFFHSATSLAEKKPAFVQSLHKMKPHFLAVKPHISIGFIGDYHFPAGRA